MDNTIDSKLISLYDKWIILVESQLELLSIGRNEESFEQLQMLEVEKRNIKLLIMEYEGYPYDQLDSTIRWSLTQAIQNLLSLNEQVEPQIKDWYDKAAQDMKQVTTQQRLLTSYGGAQSSDIISLYVDSKK